MSAQSLIFDELKHPFIDTPCYVPNVLIWIDFKLAVTQHF